MSDRPDPGPKGYLPPRAAATRDTGGGDRPDPGPKGYLPPRAAATRDTGGGDRPDPGPKGYLPPRAAARARKIVLREPMVIGWPLAALAAAVLLAVVGVVFVTRSGAPQAPFVATGPPPDLRGADRTAVVDVPGVDRDAFAVRAGGALRVFARPDAPVRWCPASRRLESPSGDVFTPEGVRIGGLGSSLAPVPSVVFEDLLYLDAEALADPQPIATSTTGAVPVCGGDG